jgi:hypothetical protein
VRLGCRARVVEQPVVVLGRLVERRNNFVTFRKSLHLHPSHCNPWIASRAGIGPDGGVPLLWIASQIQASRAV